MKNLFGRNKEQELSGAKALQFVENLESRISDLEENAEATWKYYYLNNVTSEFFTVAMANRPERQEQDRKYFLASARERIFGNLSCYLSLPSWKGQAVIKQDDVEHLAYRIRLQKAAERICDRYGIELN